MRRRPRRLRCSPSSAMAAGSACPVSRCRLRPTRAFLCGATACGPAIVWGPPAVVGLLGNLLLPAASPSAPCRHPSRCRGLPISRQPLARSSHRVPPRRPFRPARGACGAAGQLVPLPPACPPPANQTARFRYRSPSRSSGSKRYRASFLIFANRSVASGRVANSASDPSTCSRILRARSFSPRSERIFAT